MSDVVFGCLEGRGAREDASCLGWQSNAKRQTRGEGAKAARLCHQVNEAVALVGDGLHTGNFLPGEKSLCQLFAQTDS